MRRVCLFFAFTLITGTLLILPIRSQEAQRNKGMPAVADSALRAPSILLTRQNAAPPANVIPNPLPPDSEEGSNRTVVLDPAHGGADFGARGPTGLAESDVVLDFARAARIALEAQRLRVLLTREGNQGPSFDSRSAMVNGVRNVVFISLHVSSSGPVGTARTYFYVFPSGTASTTNPAVTSTTLPAPPPPSAAALQANVPATNARGTLVEWDRAQQASMESSRQLATLVQSELVRRFNGSPGMPIPAAVRQLRTIAAPAIAIEISSIDVTDAKRLGQMAQPLAEAIARAVAEFHDPSVTAVGASGGH